MNRTPSWYYRTTPTLYSALKRFLAPAIAISNTDTSLPNPPGAKTLNVLSATLSLSFHLFDENIFISVSNLKNRNSHFFSLDASVAFLATCVSI